MPKFTPAEEVTSPRRGWSLIAVLEDPRKPHRCVLAIGRWDNKSVMAMRWNGNDEKDITPGNNVCGLYRLG